ARVGHAWRRVAGPPPHPGPPLAGAAPDVQTGPAERPPLLDAGPLHAELRRTDRRDVTAGTGPDDHQVVPLGHRRLLLSRTDRNPRDHREHSGKWGQEAHRK